MDIPTSETSSFTPPNLLVTEPLFNSITYTLDLHPQRNPLFYKLVNTIDASLTGKPKDLPIVLQAINTHAPKKEAITATTTYLRQQSTTRGAIPIDEFFDNQNPAAKCLERTLLTQAVLATQGIDSSLVYYPDSPHIALEVRHKGKNYIIDSNLTARDGSITTAMYPTKFYEQRLHYTHRDPNITPNVFSPLPPPPQQQIPILSFFHKK